MKERLPAAQQARIRDLFETAIELPEEARAEFLRKACKKDPIILREVTALLSEMDSIDSPFEALVDQMIWPALETLRLEPAKLEDWLDSQSAEDLVENDPLIGKTVSRFEILKAVGRGGMGMVYQARDTVLDRDVALKFLPPSLSTDTDAKSRFTHEAKAASGLDHPNIATVYEIGETADHQLFIAMGYYPGETLKERISRGPIPIEETLTIARQITDGLDMAHTHGVVHRDIKPGNVIISASGTAVLLDFGLAKLSYESGYTQLGQLVGTIAYMSPEQARGDSIDHRTDIWSFGVVLYEMLTRSLPFGGESVQSAINKILNQDPAPPSASAPDCPKPLESILARCLAKSTDDRYQSTAELCEDLERASMGLMPTKKPHKPAWNRRSFPKWLVAGTIASILLLSLAFLFLGRSSTEEGDGHRGFSRVRAGPIADATGFFGATWGDYDNDGLIDLIVTAKTNENHGLSLYHNEGNGDFIPATESIQVSDTRGAFAPYWADQDNDGDLDVYITTDIRGPDIFLRNDGQGRLIEDETSTWERPPKRAQAAAWGDYDNDGWIDLFVATSDDERPLRNHLFRNRGDGTMESIESAATIVPGVSHGCFWSDYNNDGLVDLFVAGQSPVYYRNDGKGQLVGMPAEPNGIPEYTRDVDIGFSTADYDNDGDLDVAYTVWGEGPGVLFYRNELNHIFNDVTYLLLSDGTVRGMGASWGDYDNDGHLDFFIANSSGKNILYHNEGDGSFSAVADGPIVAEGLSTLGGNWVDYDNDGYLDLFVTNGWLSKFPQPSEMYHNEGGPNHWIILRLEGTASNRSAIGAKAWVKARIDEHESTQMREVQSGGNGRNDAGSLRLHFGLGDATEIETLRIEWPSGIVQELHDIAADQFLTITEEVPAEEAMLPTSATFTRITEGAIVEDTGKFVGGVWGDLDGDGFADVIVADSQQGGTLHYYHNNGDGSFSRVTEGILATDPIAPWSPYAADQDNDGDLDIFVTTYNDSPDAFYRNEGNGSFTKVTEANWIPPRSSTHSAAWGDYDNDGLVDLFVTTAGIPELENNHLYHNQGDGTMEPVQALPTTFMTTSHGSIWSDYDNDGDVDLFVAGQDPVQFRNDGDGNFIGVGPQKGGIPESTQDTDIGFSSADYDNDGDLDVLYTTWEPEPSCLLYRNDEGVIFQDRTHVLPQTDQVRAIGSAWGDYDNDGFQDLFIANMLGENQLFHNDGDGSFTRITESPVVQEGYRSAGCAWVDYDNNGDLDLHVTNGFMGQFEEPCELYRNNGGTNHWIVVALIGTQSNRSAIGAKVWAKTTIGGKILTQLREIQSGGNGQNGTDFRAHFGLGDAPAIDFLRIEWPSGIVQDIHDVAADQFLEIIETDTKTDPSLTHTPAGPVYFTPITEGAFVAAGGLVALSSTSRGEPEADSGPAKTQVGLEGSTDSEALEIHP